MHRWCMMCEHHDLPIWIMHTYSLDFRIKPSQVRVVKLYISFWGKSMDSAEIGDAPTEDVKIIGVELRPQSCTKDS